MSNLLPIKLTLWKDLFQETNIQAVLVIPKQNYTYNWKDVKKKTPNIPYLRFFKHINKNENNRCQQDGSLGKGACHKAWQ